MTFRGILCDVLTYQLNSHPNPCLSIYSADFGSPLKMQFGSGLDQICSPNWMLEKHHKKSSKIRGSDICGFFEFDIFDVPKLNLK